MVRLGSIGCRQASDSHVISVQRNALALGGGSQDVWPGFSTRLLRVRLRITSGQWLVPTIPARFPDRLMTWKPRESPTPAATQVPGGQSRARHRRRPESQGGSRIPPRPCPGSMPPVSVRLRIPIAQALFDDVQGIVHASIVEFGHRIAGTVDHLHHLRRGCRRLAGEHGENRINLAATHQ